MKEETVLFVALSFVLLLNAFVSVALFRSSSYSTAQVRAQTAIIWLVPVFGGLAIGLFLWSQRPGQSNRNGSDHGNWQNAEEKSYGVGHEQ